MIEILHPVADRGRIAELLAPRSGYRFVDCWTSALRELAVIDRPEFAVGTAAAERALESYMASALHDGSIERISRFVVYPWRATVVKLPDAEHFWRLRTARNRHLLTDAEQEAWARALIGVAGLSVGASALAVCALTGARRFRLAERDSLGCSNLNRLQGSVCDVGEPKLTLARRRTMELDPYCEITGFPAGYQPETAAPYLGAPGPGERLSVVIEEMDDFAMKVDIRRRARAAGIPVLMVTDHGDNAFLDVERYDHQPDYPLFHGKAGDLTELSADDLRDPRRRIELAVAIVGTGITPRTRYSLTQVGRSLASWPQLGTAVSLAGALAAVAARSIVCGKELPSGRYRLDLDHSLFGAQDPARHGWNEMGEEEFLAELEFG
ncbi:ThiF family adenylyltransferase [Nocardia asiatica]|uniref:ThiF family adenylyltransferase n=1 Tax=Nocardia asiatica TaxID=209252 RepID=UPI002454C87A|nr:ThiF family adenylyltransferase [Nocardia asiatica]